MTWAEWMESRETKRAALRRRGLDAPSRRKTAYGSSVGIMRKEFGGGRIPVWAKQEVIHGL